jgi:hypothetical protein
MFIGTKSLPLLKIYAFPESLRFCKKFYGTHKAVKIVDVLLLGFGAVWTGRKIVCYISTFWI